MQYQVFENADGVARGAAKVIAAEARAAVAGTRPVQPGGKWWPDTLADAARPGRRKSPVAGYPNCPGG